MHVRHLQVAFPWRHICSWWCEKLRQTVCVWEGSSLAVRVQQKWLVSPRRAAQSSGKLTNTPTAATLHEPDENSSSSSSEALCQSVPPDCRALDLHPSVLTSFCSLTEYKRTCRLRDHCHPFCLCRLSVDVYEHVCVRMLRGKGSGPGSSASFWTFDQCFGKFFFLLFWLEYEQLHSAWWHGSRSLESCWQIRVVIWIHDGVYGG